VNRWGAPIVATGVAVAAAVLLGIQLPADPIDGFTFSNSPFTDEGWSVLGARNQALLGTWSTDEWRLFWAQLPFNLAVLAAFEAIGVGIVQARAVSLLCSVTAVGLLTYMLARRTGNVPGLVAGLALATSTLFLYYGRLALLEPMVLLFLVAGFGLLVLGWPHRTVIGGIAAGGSLALAIGTKPSAAFAVAGILAGALIAGGSVPGLRRRVATCTAVIGMAAIAWLVAILVQPGLLEIIFQIWPQQDMPASFAEAFERARIYLQNSDGALAMASPLLVGAAVATVMTAASWRHLTPLQRAATGAAIGWILVGWAVLVIVPYRPNRYVVQLLPALAVLLAVGLAALRPRFERLLPATRAAITAVLVAGLAWHGATSLVRWQSEATYRLPAIQARVLDLVTDDRPMEGGPAPTMGMRVPAPAIVTRFGPATVTSLVNEGDLYDRYGIGWVFIGPAMKPAWAADHPEAWANRETVECFDWGSGPACLVRVP
jgi:4-amino-4-deoxy-L-arabinose transferase-like glycosyltransferase